MTHRSDHHARKVEASPISEAQEPRVRQACESVVRALYERVRQDGRHGACIDVARSMSWMLTEMEIDNYFLVGGLKITLPEESNLGAVWFSQYDTYHVDAGHAWVVAPPFKIVDCALKHQPYHSSRIPDLLPDYIIEKGEPTTELHPMDYCSRPLLEQVVADRSMVPGVNKIVKQVAKFTSEFNAHILDINGVKFKYVPCKVGFTPLNWDPDEMFFGGESVGEILDSLP